MKAETNALSNANTGSLNSYLKKSVRSLTLRRLKRKRNKIKTNANSKTGTSFFSDYSVNNYIQDIQDIKKTIGASIRPLVSDKGMRSEKIIELAGYYRLKNFADLAKGLITNIYLLSIKYNFNKGGSSRIIFGVQMNSISQSLIPGFDQIPLIKVCVPSDISKKSHITERCVFGDCADDYNSAKKCKNSKKSSPSDTMVVK